MSLAAALFATAAAGGISNVSVNLFYGLGRKSANRRDQWAAALSEVRFAKMNKNFEEALITVDTVLARDPGFPEALFLKAQVLFDGLGDRGGAKDCLIRMFAAETDKSACTRRWGKALYRQIAQQQKAGNKGG